MIPEAYLKEWRQLVPWSRDEMVEQDLIISRLLVELFNEPQIYNSLAFRGGTALYKLFIKSPMRYSEDIDLVQTTSEPIGNTLNVIRNAAKQVKMNFLHCCRGSLGKQINFKLVDDYSNQ